MQPDRVLKGKNLLGLGFLAVFSTITIFSSHLWAENLVKGKVEYQLGFENKALPDEGAKCWLFSGQQKLALEAYNRLLQFERDFPEGGTEIAHRSIENEARKAAMILMTYAYVHRDSLLLSTEVDGNGNFSLSWEGNAPVTLIIESGVTSGSYHMKRYYVELIDPEGQMKPLKIDFGRSHLEGHQ